MEIHIPFNIMHVELSCPTEEVLEFLVRNDLVYKIKSKYPSPEDMADAFDGAFTAVHIYNHLSMGGDKETWLNEILGWYNVLEMKDFNSPFYYGLKLTLGVCGLEKFYFEVLRYIELNEGKID